MKALAKSAGVLALTATGAVAGGLDRTGQPIGIIFQDGSYGEFSIAVTNPTVSGRDLATGGTTGTVASNFVSLNGGFKFDVNEKLSFSAIFEEPFGSDTNYAATATSASLGGTSAVASTQSSTFVLRYKVSDQFSVHAGARHQSINGDITLAGGAYASLNGYNVKLGNTTGWGYLVGAAYERPEIALRVALTYNSAITHKSPTTESVGGTTVSAGTQTTIESPQSVNLDFQTGIAPDTLLFGSIRWAEWSTLDIAPAFFQSRVGAGLVDLDDSVTYTIGVGRRFDDQWSGSLSFTYEEQSSDDLVSPLAPTNGLFAVSAGYRYQATENMVISGGVRYNWLGNARPETGTPDTARAQMSDNHAVSFGMKVGFNF